MSVEIQVSGVAAEAVARVVPTLVADNVASQIAAHNAALWGTAAEPESSIRLGWVDAATISRPLVIPILALRDELRAAGVNHYVLGGMGGSSLAPELITTAAGVELTILDSTEPGQVRAALADRLSTSALIISSKSGSTIETDSQKRVYEAAFQAAGIDPAKRIIVVTDPDSPLDKQAREAGYRVFNADPNVGGRYSALTAFGLVPSGLAGVDISALLDEAEAVGAILASDSPTNPALVLGAAMATTLPRRDKLGIVSDGTRFPGFADWAEQLIAESTGKEGTGVLPVVLEVDAPEISLALPDLQIVRIVADASEVSSTATARDEIRISGPLGAQLLVWEYATAIAGRILGINPFDQPDVESAKTAARGLLDARPVAEPAAFVSQGIEVRGTPDVIGAASDLHSAIEVLLEELGNDGYLSIQAYVDRAHFSKLSKIRRALAARSGRPVTFGWGPRFLHSTGQYHKGGVANGVFLQITQAVVEDLEIPGRPFSFGQLIAAQSSGDASVLASKNRPVLTLHLTNPEANIETLFTL